jgi:hypothetical protein
MVNSPPLPLPKLLAKLCLWLGSSLPNSLKHPHYFFSFTSNILHGIPFSNTLDLFSSLMVHTNFHAHTKQQIQL